MKQSEIHARKRAARTFVLENIEHGFSRENVSLLMPAVSVTETGCAYVDVRIFVPEIDVSETMAKRKGEKPAATLPACAISMGCLCALHARGGSSDARCDASE